MFEQNYNSEAALKKIARIVGVVSGILIGLFVVFALALIGMLGNKADDLWFIPVALAVVGTLLGLTGIVFSHVIWGLGDLVGTNRIIANAKQQKKDTDHD